MMLKIFSRTPYAMVNPTGGKFDQLSTAKLALAGAYPSEEGASE